MKSLFFKICLLVSAVTFVACEKEEQTTVFDYNGGQTAYLFMRTATQLGVNEGEAVTIEIPVGVTTRSNSERVIPITIDPASTATPEMYNMSGLSAVIPAGEFIGSITISGNFDAIPEEGVATLIFNIDESYDTLDDKGTHVVNLFRSCPTDLAGFYSVTTTYGYHDFLPDYPSNTMDVEVTALGDNTYHVADFSGGLYTTGPYAIEYGTNAAPASQLDLVFSVNCGNISWENEIEPYGPLVMTTGGVNSYNEETGVFTISWTATAYGEYAVSVYTPL